VSNDSGVIENMDLYGFRRYVTKFVVGWGSAPDPAGGTYSAPQTP